MPPHDSSPLFSSLANDPDLIELVQEFVNELKHRVAAIRSAADTSDLDKVARLAHQLKMAGGSCGFEVIGAAAAELESATRNARSIEQIRREMDNLVVLCCRAVAGPPK